MIVIWKYGIFKQNTQCELLPELKSPPPSAEEEKQCEFILFMNQLESKQRIKYFPVINCFDSSQSSDVQSQIKMQISVCSINFSIEKISIQDLFLQRFCISCWVCFYVWRNLIFSYFFTSLSRMSILGVKYFSRDYLWKFTFHVRTD